MNLMLAMIVISEACLGICAWLSPDYLRRVAASLLARADVIDAARAEHRRRIQFWREEFGVAHKQLAATTHNRVKERDRLLSHSG